MTERLDFSRFIPPDIDETFAAYEAKKAREKTAQETAAIDELCKTFGLRERVSGMLTRGELHATEAREICAKWRAQFGPDGKSVLLLLGAMGTGKTVAVAEQASQSEPYRYLRSQKLALLAKSSYSTEVEAYESTLQFPGLLIIDEVGFERDKDSATQAIHEAVDMRKWCSRPLVLISNLSVDQFKQTFDARTVDRLREYGMVKTIGAASLRGAK